MMLSVFVNLVDAGLHSFFHYLFVPANFFNGPGFYFVSAAMLEERAKPHFKYYLHFLPFVFSVGLVLFVSFFDDFLITYQFKIGILQVPFAESIVSISMVYTLTYSMIVLKRTFKDISNTTNKKILRIIFIAFGILSIAANMTGIFGVLTHSRDAINLLVLINAIIMILATILTQRFPHLMLDLTIDPKNSRQIGERSSKLIGRDIQAIDTALHQSMKEDKLYRDNNLNLARLSAVLKITPHQLSEYLNQHKQLNFAGFVNQYRIEEAKQMLLNDSKSSIRSIAYRVGFNSLTTFNSAFRKATGLTGPQFRKNRDQNKMAEQ